MSPVRSLDQIHSPIDVFICAWATVTGADPVSLSLASKESLFLFVILIGGCDISVFIQARFLFTNLWTVLSNSLKASSFYCVFVMEFNITSWKMLTIKFSVITATFKLYSNNNASIINLNIYYVLDSRLCTYYSWCHLSATMCKANVIIPPDRPWHRAQSGCPRAHSCCVAGSPLWAGCV